MTFSELLTAIRAKHGEWSANGNPSYDPARAFLDKSQAEILVCGTAGTAGIVIAKAWQEGLFKRVRGLPGLHETITAAVSAHGTISGRWVILAVLLWLEDRGHKGISDGGGNRNQFDRLADALEDEAKPKRNQSRRTNPRTPTTKQIEALKIVGECNGNIAKAARQLGRDPTTVQQHYNAGLKKAGGLFSKLEKPKVTAIPSDPHGQIAVADDDDGPAAIGPRFRGQRKQQR